MVNQRGFIFEAPLLLVFILCFWRSSDRSFVGWDFTAFARRTVLTEMTGYFSTMGFFPVFVK